MDKAEETEMEVQSSETASNYRFETTSELIRAETEARISFRNGDYRRTVAFLQELLEDAANRVLGPEDILSAFENSTLFKFCRYFLQERPLVTYAEEVVPFLEKVVNYCVLSMQNGRIPGPAFILAKLFHTHSYLFSESSGSSSEDSYEGVEDVCSHPLTQEEYELFGTFHRLPLTQEVGEHYEILGKLLDRFGAIQGFDLTKDLLLEPSTSWENISSILWMITQPIDVLGDTLLERFHGMVFENLKNRMLNISDEELRITERHHFENIVLALQKMIKSQATDLEIAAQAMQQLRLDFAFRCLRCRSSLDKRLGGLQDINFVNDSIMQQAAFAHMSAYGILPAAAIALEKAQDFAMSLKREEFIKEIFERQVHTELVKRSSSPIVTMATHDVLNEEDLQVIWKSLENRHETERLVIFETIARCSAHLKEELKDFLFGLVNSMPVNWVNYQIMTWMWNLSVQSLMSRSEGAWTGTGEKEVMVFWRFLECVEDVPEDVAKLCAKQLREVLKRQDFFSDEERLYFLRNFVDNIRKGVFVGQSLMMVNALIDAIIGSRSLGMDEINGTTHVVDAVFDDMIRRSEEVGSFSNDIFGLTHERILFVSHVFNERSSLRMTVPQFTILFANIMDESMSDEEKKLLGSLSWESILAFEDALVVLKEHFPQQNLSCATSQVFSIFQKLYSTCNADGQHEGIETAWKIAFEAEDDKVSQDACTFILEQYTRPKYRREFVNFCLEELKSYDHMQDVRRVARAIDLLKNLVETVSVACALFRGIAPSRHGELSENETSVEIRIQVAGEKERFSVFFSNGGMIAVLKHQISRQVGIDPEKLRLFCSGRELKDTETLSTRKTQDVIFMNATIRAQPFTSLCPEDVMLDEDIPTNILLEEENFTAMFDVLRYHVFAQKVWDLLMQLPTNDLLERQLFEFNGTAAEWTSAFFAESDHRSLYFLQILHRALVRDPMWSKTLGERNGVVALIMFLKDVHAEEFGTTIMKRVVTFVLSSLSIIMLQAPELLDPALLPPMLDKCMDFAFVVASQMVRPVSDVFDQVRLFESCFNFIVTLIEVHPGLWSQLINKESIQQWFSVCLLNNNSTKMRNAVLSALEKMCVNTHSCEESRLRKSWLLDLVMRFLNSTADAPGTKEYFSLLRTLFEAKTLPEENVAAVFEKLATLLLRHESKEKFDGIAVDEFLVGLLRCLGGILAAYPFESISVASDLKLVPFVFHKCLFLLEKVSCGSENLQLVGPMCCNLSSRDEAYSLLIELCRADVVHMMQNVEMMGMIAPSFEEPRRESYNFWPPDLAKSETGYVGLKNLGCTCYMNSLFQQIYMVPEFRHAILRSKKADGSEFEESSVTRQLQNIFGHLELSDAKFFDTSSFCEYYTDADGRRVNTALQMDVDEFVNRLFEVLEREIGSDEVIRSVFGGISSDQLVSDVAEYPYFSETTTPFYRFLVTVKNKKNLHEGLMDAIQNDRIEDYQCDVWDRKIPVLKRSCIRDLPDNLIIHLKRFSFDYDYMRKLKVNDHFEFPFELDMRPYMRETIIADEGLDVPIEEDVQNRGPDYYEFELMGILVHSGTADSGHYYSFIKERESRTSSKECRWLQFNDRNVDYFDEEDVPQECFGGYEVFYNYDPIRRCQVPQYLPKQNSAYMLFYRRKCPIDVVASADARESVPTSIARCVVESNFAVHKDFFLFDAGLFRFMKQLALLADDELLKNPEFCERTAVTFTSMSVQVLGHVREKSFLEEWCAVFSKIMSRNAVLSNAFLRVFVSYPERVREVFLQNTNIDSRESFLSLVSTAMKAAYEGSRRIVREDGSLSPLAEFVDLVISFLPEADFYWRRFETFFGIPLAFVRLGPDAVKYMMRKSIISQFVSFVLERSCSYFSHVKRDRIAMSDAKTSADFSNLFRTMAVVLKEYWENGLPLSAHDEMTLQEGLFVEKLMLVLLKQNPSCFEDIQYVCRALCLENRTGGILVLKMLSQGINDVNADAFDPFVQVYDMILSIEDDLVEERCVFIVDTLCEVIIQNFKYKSATTKTIAFIGELCKKHVPLAFAFRSSVMKWIMTWLVMHEVITVRDEARRFIFSLGVIFEEEKPAWQNEVFSVLMDSVDNAMSFAQTIAAVSTPAYVDVLTVERFQLYNYFDVIAWCIKDGCDLTKFEQKWGDLVEMYTLMQERKLITDYNKMGWISMFHAAIQSNPSIVGLVLQEDVMETLLMVPPAFDRTEHRSLHFTLPLFGKYISILIDAMRAHPSIVSSSASVHNFISSVIGVVFYLDMSRSDRFEVFDQFQKFIDMVFEENHHVAERLLEQVMNLNFKQIGMLGLKLVERWIQRSDDLARLFLLEGGFSKIGAAANSKNYGSYDGDENSVTCDGVKFSILSTMLDVFSRLGDVAEHEGVMRMWQESHLATTLIQAVRLLGYPPDLKEVCKKCVMQCMSVNGCRKDIVKAIYDSHHYIELKDFSYTKYETVFVRWSSSYLFARRIKEETVSKEDIFSYFELVARVTDVEIEKCEDDEDEIRALARTLIVVLMDTYDYEEFFFRYLGHLHVLSAKYPDEIAQDETIPYLLLGMLSRMVSIPESYVEVFDETMTTLCTHLSPLFEEKGYSESIANALLEKLNVVFQSFIEDNTKENLAALQSIFRRVRWMNDLHLDNVVSLIAKVGDKSLLSMEERLRVVEEIAAAEELQHVLTLLGISTIPGSP
eukprot:TRINITY_DN3593_c1_g1_i1.p1 TRINITY_DN3593_c1_g1~~TRINITY_DN3593_c1_g1_i1.p1  ORF type:complete len:2734 (-),score=638.27 TRINITY_DN3593_c1_g1_i1:1709-9772(-)